MMDADEVSEWDFVTLAARWNLYLLPALLVLVAAVLVIRRQRRPAGIAGLAGVRTIQRIALIHFVLALRALIYLAQELQTYRTMGIFQSNPVSNLITVLARPGQSAPGVWPVASPSRYSPLGDCLVRALVVDGSRDNVLDLALRCVHRSRRLARPSRRQGTALVSPGRHTPTANPASVFS